MFSKYDSSKLFVLSDGVHFTEKNDEILVLNKKKDLIFELDDVSKLIWKNLKDPISLDQLVEKVCQKFAVTQQKARQDIEDWLKEALGFKLIKQV